MAIETWRHRPTVKQVCFYTGANADEIIRWINDPTRAYLNDLAELVIVNQQAGWLPSVGDPVILGQQGYPYTCPPSIFHAEYEPVGE